MMLWRRVVQTELSWFGSVERGLSRDCKQLSKGDQIWSHPSAHTAIQSRPRWLLELGKSARQQTKFPLEIWAQPMLLLWLYKRQRGNGYKPRRYPGKQAPSGKFRSTGILLSTSIFGACQGSDQKWGSLQHQLRRKAHRSRSL